MTSSITPSAFNAMFITDLDGTLFTDERTVTAEDRDALEALGRKGILRVIATGRSIYSFHKAMDLLGYRDPDRTLPVDHVIFSTGAGTMDFPEGNLFHSAALDRDQVTLICRELDHRQLDYMVHAPVPRTREFLYRSHGRSNPDFEERIRMYQDYGAPLSSNGLNGFDGFTEVLAIVPPKEGDTAAREIQQALPGFSVIRATSPLDHRSTWIEVFAPGVNKSRAAARLAEHYQIPPDRIWSVGNDYNDLDLLEWSAKGLVVANAPDPVRRGFETVAGNNHNGVAQAARRMIKEISCS